MELIDFAKDIISNYGHPIFEGILILLLCLACWRLFKQEKYLELIKFNLTLKDFGFYYELNRDEKNKALISENFQLKNENELLKKDNSSNKFLLFIVFLIGLFAGSRNTKKDNVDNKKQKEKDSNADIKIDKDTKSQVNEIVNNFDFDRELKLKDLDKLRELMEKQKK